MSKNIDRNDLSDFLPADFFVSELYDFLDYNVYWDFKEVLNSAKNERPIQKFLEQNPLIMASLLDGHLGRWVIPQKRLGCEYVTDFVVGDSSSSGMRWIAVELENPTKKMFNKNGDISAILNHAIRQITDWRSWISDNKAYAQRKWTRGGLGLYGIRPKLKGYIFIGRSSDLLESNEERRSMLSEDLNLHIRTYDWLLRRVAVYSGNSAEIKI